MLGPLPSSLQILPQNVMRLQICLAQLSLSCESGGRLTLDEHLYTAKLYLYLWFLRALRKLKTGNALFMVLIVEFVVTTTDSNTRLA